MLKIKKKFLYPFTFLVLISALVFFFREDILLQVGDFLLFSEEPEEADIIVILRGDVFERIIQGAELYKHGYGDKIMIPMALADDVSRQFKEFNVILPTEQEELESIFKQLNIPEDGIILSTYTPGGGTVGEAYRVKKDLLNLGIDSFIVVTSWYHTRRVHNIYKRVFSDTNIKFWIVASKYGKDNSKNWWHYRYVTRRVLMEIPRLLISYLNPIFNLSFHDDPVTE